MTSKPTGTDWQKDAGYSRRTVFWIAVVVTVSFVVALVTMAFGPDIAETDTGNPSTFSESALGHRALIAFLKESGYSVLVRQTERLFVGSTRTPVVVAEPNVDTEAGAKYVERLMRTAGNHSAPVILILPKWYGISYRTKDGIWIRGVSRVTDVEVQEVLDILGDVHIDRRVSSRESITLNCESTWGENLNLELISPQFLKPSPMHEALVWGNDGVLVARIESSFRPPVSVYVVSDPDLVNNHGLARRDNAIVFTRLLSEVLQAQSVVFDEIVHGHARERSFLAEMLRYPLVLSVLHGVLVFGLVLWAGMGRFGKPRIAPPRLPPGKISLIDNTSKLLSYRGRVLDSAVQYFHQTLLSVGRYYHLPRDLSREELLKRLGEISRGRGLKMNLVAMRDRLESLDKSERRVEEQSVKSALALHQWLREMTDGH